MANPKHLNLLKQGVEVWNRWREQNPEIRPDLTQADLREANLGLANLSGADLRGAEGLTQGQINQAPRGKDASLPKDLK